MRTLFRSFVSVAFCFPLLADQASIPLGGCGDWKAVFNDHSRTLSVTGACQFRTGGYTVTLVKANRSGTKPAILVLYKTIEEPSGMAIQQISTVPVAYRETNSKEYKQIEIRARKSSKDRVLIEVTRED